MKIEQVSQHFLSILLFSRVQTQKAMVVAALFMVISLTRLYKGSKFVLCYFNSVLSTLYLYCIFFAEPVIPRNAPKKKVVNEKKKY